jgi:hypothetical protein
LDEASGSSLIPKRGRLKHNAIGTTLRASFCTRVRFGKPASRSLQIYFTWQVAAIPLATLPQMQNAQLKSWAPMPLRLRKERDSNPRYSCPYNGFRDRPIQPLWHLSEKGM